LLSIALLHTAQLHIIYNALHYITSSSLNTTRHVRCLGHTLLCPEADAQSPGPSVSEERETVSTAHSDLGSPKADGKAGAL